MGKSQAFKSSLHCRAFATAMAVLYSFSSMAQDRAASNTPVSNQLKTEIDVNSADTVSRKAVAQWSLFLASDSFANERERAQIMGFGLTGKLKYRFTSSLFFDAAASVRMQNGYAQSVFGENTPKSGIELSEAVLRLRPFSNFEFSAGAIDQGHLNSPFLVSSRPFPGLMQSFFVGPRGLRAELKTQQTIPSSTSLSTKAVDIEPTPYFLTETLTITSRVENSPIRVKAFGTHFQFQNLPRAVARESDVLGNTIVENSPGSTQFKNQFEGWVAGGEAAWNFAGSMIWKLDAQMQQNTRAPLSYRNAQILSTSLKMNLPGGVEFVPKAGTFFAESDAAPALYNDSEMGHNNRTGWLVEAATTVRDAGFKIAATYVESDVLQANPLQSRQQYFMLKFETLYEVL